MEDHGTKNGYITTYTKKRFSPIEPDIALIDIEDIAHALSLMCRGNGHLKHFFSVGQHSLYCAKEAIERGYSERVQLACLLHDASEAYIADITRPVKKHLPKYLEFEGKLQEMIWHKFLGGSLTEEERRQVFEIDDSMLYYEMKYFMEESIYIQAPKLVTAPSLGVRDFLEIEQAFLALFEEIMMRQ